MSRLSSRVLHQSTTYHLTRFDFSLPDILFELPAREMRGPRGVAATLSVPQAVFAENGWIHKRQVSASQYRGQTTNRLRAYQATTEESWAESKEQAKTATAKGLVCNRCRTAKLRCSRDRPNCSHCLKSGALWVITLSLECSRVLMQVLNASVNPSGSGSG